MAVIKHKNQRVGVFIDTQNLYHSAKNLFKSRVNFGAIVKEAVAGRQLVRAIAYVITTESGEEKGFFEALGKVGIETKTKPLQIFFGGAKKADWDVGIAVDAIKVAPKLDTIILASGDGDFVPL
ncbi:MAG: NYN domain-containing protein, partial [Patescibacteria group bacterium]